MSKNGKEKETGPGVDIESKRVKYDYIKSNFFRVLHVDGVFGGSNPNVNTIFMTVWNERWPIPKQTTHKLGEDGKILGEIHEERISRDAIIREVEVGLEMNLAVAKKMRDWLDEKIRNAEEIIEKAKKGEG